MYSNKIGYFLLSEFIFLALSNELSAAKYIQMQHALIRLHIMIAMIFRNIYSWLLFVNFHNICA